MDAYGARPARACFLRPDKPDEAYFWANDQFVLISVGPGTDRDRIVTGPAGILDRWPSLKQAGFSTITTTLPTANNPHDIYFFSGYECAFVKVIPATHKGYLMAGPKSVAEFWPHLGRLGWKTIDAACHDVEGDAKIYFFKDTEYVVIEVAPGTNDGIVVDGPRKFVDKWGGTGFNSVDSVLPNYEDKTQIYFFSGSEYALVNISDGRVVDGPHQVARKWPSLHEAGFY